MTPMSRSENSLDVREDRLRAVLAEVARGLRTGDVTGLATSCVDFCACAVGATAGGLVASQPGLESAWTLTASSEAARQLLELDLYVSPGPCRHCLIRGAPVVESLSRTGRDPSGFAALAREHGFVWVRAEPLRRRGAVVGAVVLFGEAGGPPAQADVELARDVAEVTVATQIEHDLLSRSETQVDQLNTALDTRLVIEQAKGVLAARHGITIGEAFTRLRTQARSRRMNIHTLARDVIDDRERP